jgi:hypothetical protein
MTDQELKDLVASLAIESKKTDKQIRELREAQLKTDEQLRETDEQIRELREAQLKTDQQMEKTDKKLDRIATLVGNISNNQGDITEEYFVNSLKDYLKVGKMDFDYLIANFRAQKGHKILAEYDILLVNGESVAIIEVKYKAHLKDLDKLPNKIEQLKNLPQYKGYKVYAGIATFYATKELIKKADEMGYFILQRKGDMLVTHSEHLRAA